MRRHQYRVPQVLGGISVVVSTATSLRSAGRAVAVIQECAGMVPESPSWWSTRLWLVRVGSYKLTRPKEQAEDWVWLVEHVVQIGQEKCWWIVGIRLSAVRVAGPDLAHGDVEPLAICPGTKSPGDIVYHQLEEARKHTGVPREILCAHGSDLAKGIRQFCQEPPANLLRLRHQA